MRDVLGCAFALGFAEVPARCVWNGRVVRWADDGLL